MAQPEGLVLARRQAGRSVADGAGAGFTPSTTVEVRFESADGRVAGLLAILEGAEVTVRDRVLRADGVAAPPRDRHRRR